MDNASKALIIAGAVLIAVMLVSVGVLIYNQSRSVIDVAGDKIGGMSASMFNNEYSQYVGDKQSKAAVNSLIDAVNGLNRSSSDYSIELSGATADDSSIPTYKHMTDKNATYKVEDTAWDSAGFITTISITKN